MNFEPTPQHAEFAAGIRAFCEREIGPRALEFERAGSVPRDVFKKLAQIGYTGLLFDPADGGQGATVLEATLAQEIVSEFCGSTFFSVGASMGLFGSPVAKFGTPEQKSKWLHPVIAGDKIGCLGVTEPGAGSDVQALASVAKRVAGGWSLSGQKTYITNAPVADFALILAKAVDSDGAEIGFSHFVVERGTDGVQFGAPMKKLGLHGSPTGEIFLENCLVPEGNVIGALGKGFRHTMEVFNFERLALAAYSCGVMAACLAESKSYAKTRRSFGKAIQKHQAVAFMLADMLTKYQSAQILLHKTAWDADQVLARGGRMSELNSQCAVVKLLASTHARETTNMAVQLHGGAGYMEEYKVARLFRDIKLAEIGGGTSQIQAGIIARAEEKRY